MKKGEWVTSVGRWERGPNTLGDREKNPAHRRHRAGWFHRSPTGTSLTLPDDSYRMVTVWLLASNSPSDLKKTHPSALLRGIGGVTPLNSERLISEEQI